MTNNEKKIQEVNATSEKLITRKCKNEIQIKSYINIYFGIGKGKGQLIKENLPCVF